RSHSLPDPARSVWHRPNYRQMPSQSGFDRLRSYRAGNRDQQYVFAQLRTNLLQNTADVSRLHTEQDYVSIADGSRVVDGDIHAKLFAHSRSAVGMLHGGTNIGKSRIS